MNKAMILSIEDDAAIRNLITTALETHGYRAAEAWDGGSGVLEILSRNPDVILLDLGLPDMDGIELLRKIRTWSKTPVIVISARSEDKDKIEALDSGADDYLTKPFSVEELLARLRVAIRRMNDIGNGAVQEFLYENGELRIDYAAGCVYLKGEELHLTPMEYRLLSLLAKNEGKVLTRTFITKEIWGASWDSEITSLRVFMASLRKKIEDHPAEPKYIQTHVGVGYRMLKYSQDSHK